MSLQSDERLVSLARTGSALALGVVLERYRKPLVGYCTNLLGSDRAEDIAQETLARGADEIKTGQRELQLRAWLFRVAHNLAINELARARNRDEQLSETAAHSDQPASALESAEDMKALFRAIRKLPESQRFALVLREFEDRSINEIARALEVTENNVYQLLHRARARLRDGLGVLLPLPLLRWLLNRSEAPMLSDPATAGIGGGAVKAAVVVAVGALAVGGGAMLKHGDGQSGKTGKDDAVAGAPANRINAANPAAGARPARPRRPGPVAPINANPGAGTGSPIGGQPQNGHSRKAHKDRDKQGDSSAGNGSSNGSGERHWLATETVSRARGGGGDVALDPNGNALAVWSQADGIAAAFRPGGGHFGEPALVSASGSGASNPQVVLDSGGNAVAVWERSNGNTSWIEAATRAAGAGFSAPQAISSQTEIATEPKVASNASGDTAIVWSYGDRVVVSQHPAGGSFTAARVISDPGDQVSTPQVAIDHDGAVLAVWQAFDGVSSRIKSASKAAGADFGPAQQISAGRGSIAPTLASNADGQAVAAWISAAGVPWKVMARSRSRGRDFSQMREIGSGPMIGGASAAIDSRGNAVITWESRKSKTQTTGYKIDAALATANGSLDMQQTLSDNVGGSDLASDLSGNSVSVWLDPQSNSVVAAFRPDGGSFGAPSTLANTSSEAPKVTSNASGDAAAIWSDGHVQIASFARS